MYHFLIHIIVIYLHWMNIPSMSHLQNNWVFRDILHIYKVIYVIEKWLYLRQWGYFSLNFILLFYRLIYHPKIISKGLIPPKTWYEKNSPILNFFTCFVWITPCYRRENMKVSMKYWQLWPDKILPLNILLSGGWQK